MLYSKITSFHHSSSRARSIQGRYLQLKGLPTIEAHSPHQTPFNNSHCFGNPSTDPRPLLSPRHYTKHSTCSLLPHEVDPRGSDPRVFFTEIFFCLRNMCIDIYIYNLCHIYVHYVSSYHSRFLFILFWHRDTPYFSQIMKNPACIGSRSFLPFLPGPSSPLSNKIPIPAPTQLGHEK